MGRPPKPASKKQDRLIMLRLTQAEKTRVSRVARRKGLPAATWIRLLALEAAAHA